MLSYLELWCCWFLRCYRGTKPSAELCLQWLYSFSSVCRSRSPKALENALCGLWCSVLFSLVTFLGNSKKLTKLQPMACGNEMSNATRVQSSSDTSFVMVLIVINIRFSYLSEGLLLVLVSRKLSAFLMVKHNFLWMTWEWVPQQEGKEFAEVTNFFSPNLLTTFQSRICADIESQSWMLQAWKLMMSRNIWNH